MGIFFGEFDALFTITICLYILLAASCKDNDVNCHRWINFCASYPNIRKQCPLTCKQCRKYHPFFCNQANLIVDENNLFLAASEAH